MPEASKPLAGCLEHARICMTATLAKLSAMTHCVELRGALARPGLGVMMSPEGQSVRGISALPNRRFYGERDMLTHFKFQSEGNAVNVTPQSLLLSFSLLWFFRLLLRRWRRMRSARCRCLRGSGVFALAASRALETRARSQVQAFAKFDTMCEDT